jgi:hypothetical protein
MAPTVQGFDSAELTVGAYTLGFVHPPGYPLYIMVGHLFAQLPFSNVGVRLNLMSVSFGVLTVIALYQLLLTQTHDWRPALISAALFATAPIFWSQAVRAEVYTLHTFLVVCILLAWWYAHKSAQSRVYVVCFILLGLSMGNHSTTALLWGAILICAIYERLRWKWIALGGSLLGIGVTAVLYLYFPLRAAYPPTIDYIQPYFNINLASPSSVWWLVSFQAFRCSFYADQALTKLLDDAVHLLFSIWTNSLGIGFILGLWGWWRLWFISPLWNRLLTVYFLVNIVAFLTYHVVDKEAMFIPIYIVGSLWVVCGIDGLRAWLGVNLRQSSFSGATLLMYAALAWCIIIGVWLNWPLVDLSQSRRVYDYSRQLFDEVEPSTLIVNHWVSASVLDYLQKVEGRRPDLQIINLDFYFLGLQAECNETLELTTQEIWFEWLDKHVGQQPVCFLEPLPPTPDKFRWTVRKNCWILAAAEGRT